MAPEVVVDPNDCQPGYACSDPIPVKAVVVTMFEIGEDEGDLAGEFQLWKERRNLNVQIPFPHSHHDLFLEEETGILVMVTGIGTMKSTASIMALGLDHRFDLSQAYWLVAGIAGIDPEDATIGSAAWAHYLVDGDLSHEIDPREIPEDWKYGYFARGTDGPNATEPPEPTGELFVLNEGLRDWAYELTKDIEIPESEGLIAEREQFTEHEMARTSPKIMKGDHVAAMTFWHGEMMNDWANDWVKFWTEGEGEFVTSAMEDTGTLQSLTYLDAIGRVNVDRVMVLRSGSNFSMPPPGFTAAEYLLRENEVYSGMEAALEALYLAGTTVVDELVTNWDIYADEVPSAE
ncbi:MAG: purine nucleoside permease [Pseudomonadota bacterium]